MNNAAIDLSPSWDSLHMKGRYHAQQDFQDEGAFHNPYSRHTTEWTGYHYIESKQFRQDLDQSYYQQEPY